MNILIGNIISGIAAVFTAMSSLSHGKKKIYGFQAMQCLTMAVASIFFLSYSGITTFLLCAARNYMLTTTSYSKKVYIFFLISVAALGLIFNNRGLIGLLPVVTTIIYSVGQYHMHTEMKIKSNIALNLILWTIYDIIILDYVSTVVDAVTAVLTFVSMHQLRKSGKNKNA